ncbi:tryptophanase [Wenzhouxiangella sp. EGI_FJ10409]|uniref:tryptophanase n=1 Tax=Wenzhouxiangella sp. EGI_FJ10409 TaxID=3243767 RepID=UPI0035E3783C
MSQQFRTVIEPFRIKAVEPIAMTTREERERFLESANYNPFKLKSEQVIIDLLTDSGTSAMSAEQWAGMMRGDESYAGSVSWQRLEKVIKGLTGYPHILPTHQGRAAERILYSHLGGEGKVFLNNTHFDTTRANIEYSGAEAIDCVTPEAGKANSKFPFKGNADVGRMAELVAERGAENIGAIILTVTNNSGGGQAVSMENAREVRDLCRKHGILFILDACRIAENAWFIKQDEAGYGDKSCREIATEMFGLADGCVMSAKKDALVNMGGFLALNDAELAEHCTSVLIITEGYTTYGGLSGRDMEAIAIGLDEIFNEDYLRYRTRSTAYLGDHLDRLGIPVIKPIGGHAVYVDAGKLYDHLPVDQYPGQSLVCELYKMAGIRSVEIGSVMFGKYDADGKLIPAPRELVRLAIPRRVYTQSHVDYLIEAFEIVRDQRHSAPGYRITWEPKFLRHFTSDFEPIG